MAKHAKSLSRYCLVILPLYTNKFRHIRNQCVSSLFGDRAFIDNAERLLLSYQSVYAEARIYTRQFGWRCEFVCKN